MVILNIILSIYAYMVITLSSIFFFCISWWLMFFERKYRNKFAQGFVMAPMSFLINYVALGIRLKVVGRENIDKKRRTLYISNHQSWIDISTFVKKTNSVALSKKEVKHIPFMGALTNWSGTIYFDRSNRADRMQILKDIRNLFNEGQSLCFFPEGTRGRGNGGMLLRPNFAILKLCYKMDIPVVASAIEGSANVYPRKRLYFKFFKKVVVKYSPPIYPGDFSTSDAFCNACWERVKKTYKEINEEFFNR